VRISGWTDLPPAGTPFGTANTKKDAEKLAEERAALASLSYLLTEPGEGGVELPLIIKTDVTGSLEAIKHELRKIQHERVGIRIVSEGIGAVSEGDVKSAQASGAIVIAFSVTTDSAARDLAERTGVTINSYSIIYELFERVESLVQERAPQITVEEVLGEAKVLKAFSVTGNKHVLGAKWVSGVITVGDLVKIDRRGIPLGTGKFTNLQVARADVSEIKMEGEFGLQIESKADIAQGDTLIAYHTVTKK
jgi:translation initiation factor IF-2